MLHFTLFSKEITLAYLLAWGANPNLQDADGQTALHLSVKVAERVRNTRSAKILLLRGASRSVKVRQFAQKIMFQDSSGKRAIEMVPEVG